MPEAEFMQLAIDRAREGIAAGQSPFGASIVRDGRVITVRRDGDPTAHAEVNASRAASKVLGTAALPGRTLDSTCEPSPASADHFRKRLETGGGHDRSIRAAPGGEPDQSPAKTPTGEAEGPALNRGWAFGSRRKVESSSGSLDRASLGRTTRSESKVG